MSNASSDTKEALRATLRDLVALHGVSGFEQSVVAYFQKRVGGLADQVDVDRYGNVAAIKRGRYDRPRLMLSAHLDEIGFIVKGVEPAGFLRFGRLGGTADALLLSRRVWVNGHTSMWPLSTRWGPRRAPSNKPTMLGMVDWGAMTRNGS
jgi:putative aminopeptidase FrvX